MNKLLLLLYCLLTMFPASGQSTGSQRLPAKSYLDYYHAVAFAEESIISGSYSDAVKQYRQAFATYSYNNPIDCYIAAQVAAYTGDTLSCTDFICKGLCYGLPAETIMENPHLTLCLEKTDRRIADSCRNVYRNSINPKARATMLALFRRDQSIIQNLPPGESIYMSDGRTLRDQYRPVWDSLIREVIILAREYGFPAQKIIGTQNGDDSLFRTGPHSSFAACIFIHHGQAWDKVSDLLWAELLKGNITPQMYGVIYQYANGKDEYDNPVLYFASRYCQEKRCQKLVQERRAAIDSARWSIGLGSYEVMQQKYESRYRYYKWRRKKNRKNEPFFDFQCDLSFQRK